MSASVAQLRRDLRDPSKRPLVIADLDKTKVLAITENTGTATCLLCGAQMEAGEWKVTLPRRLGPAHTHCAGDAGWRVR